MKNEKTLANTMVGTDILGEKISGAESSVQECMGAFGGHRGGRKRSQALIFRRLDFILG